MLRFILSFGLAFISHLYLFQFNLDLNNQTTPQLISDSSVSVTLNQHLEKQSNNSSQDWPQAEKKQQPLHSQLAQKTIDHLPKKQEIPKPKPIKRIAHKNKKAVKVPEPVEGCATAPAAEDKSFEAIPQLPGLKKHTRNAVETTDHHDTPVSSENAVAKLNNTSTLTSPSSSVIKARPLYQYNPKPEYPNLARRRGWEGVVLLQVEVTEEGEVASVRLHESCGYKILDKCALRAVTTWRFLSGTRDGKRTQCTVMIPVHFKLQK